MNEEIFKIEEIDGERVLTECSKEAEGEIVIPEGVTKIGDGAFKHCKKLTSIKIPNSVNIIDSYAFFGCKELSSIILPESVKELGRCAFEFCENLKHVDIRGAINKIEDRTFIRCENLETVKLPEHVETIGENAFNCCHSLTTINFPNNLKQIGSHAFERCYGLRSIIIPNGVVEIGDFAFSTYREMDQIVIPDSVTKLGESAFSECNFGCITIPHRLVDRFVEVYHRHYNANSDVCINIPRNELNLSNGLRELLGWDSTSYKDHGKLTLAAPKPCEDDSPIPGYIRVTQIYDYSSRNSFEDQLDKIIDINTQYIMYIEPIDIERFEVCHGTAIYLAQNIDEGKSKVVVYENYDLVIEKIESSLSHLGQSVGGVVGLFNEIKLLMKDTSYMG